MKNSQNEKKKRKGFEKKHLFDNFKVNFESKGGKKYIKGKKKTKRVREKAPFDK